MELAQFTELDNALSARFHADMGDPHNERSVIYDGAVNAGRYLQSSIKMAWLLKEPYDEANGKGGGWTFTGLFDRDDLYNSTFKMPHKVTWHPIIYATFGIINGFTRWDDMPFIRHQPLMCDVVRSIAIVNAQKLPALGMTRTQFSHIADSYNKHKDLLHEQINLLSPDIFVFANTFWLYQRALGLEGVEPQRKASIAYYMKDGKLYIDAYHPAQTKVKRQVYVDDIVEAAEEWYALRSSYPLH
ncbi:hypothetical protein DDQ68_04435 [Hymenobacter nivis]|uniref:Uracil-DNA glycosylase n=1 Tax=Hymenobacter nivis TaxID=1850093 RepID=A0A2Z3GGR0_9BACT|nr:hypothetical protein DDQ68_04435 [Hymenobacter nivis]